MRKLLAGIALLAWLGANFAAGAAEPPKVKPDEVAKLVQSLASDDFDTRDAARQRLKAAGESVRKALEEAQRSTNPEVSASATELLRFINRATVIAIVTNRQGEPVAEANVILSLLPLGVPHMQQQFRGATGADGTASFGDLDPVRYRYLTVNVQAQGALPAYHQQQDATLRVGRNEFRLTCQDGARVHGVVLGKDKKPVPQQEVRLMPAVYRRQANWAALGRVCPTAQSDDKGVFEFRGLHPQEYFIAILDENGKVVHEGKTLKLEADRVHDAGEIATSLVPAPAPPAGNKAPEPKPPPKQP